MVGTGTRRTNYEEPTGFRYIQWDHTKPPRPRSKFTASSLSICLQKLCGPISSVCCSSFCRTQNIHIASVLARNYQLSLNVSSVFFQLRVKLWRNGTRLGTEPRPHWQTGKVGTGGKRKLDSRNVPICEPQTATLRLQ